MYGHRRNTHDQAERLGDTLDQTLHKCRGKRLTGEALQAFLNVCQTTINSVATDVRSPDETLMSRKVRRVHHAFSPKNEPLLRPAGPSSSNGLSVGVPAFDHDCRLGYSRWAQARGGLCNLSVDDDT
ncbi:hypothetical protein AHF37_03933 [Paragonimus kellicotti]|nr:hypothetical protein AHF37_03933 [Paragonimus kellicotti]